MIVVFLIHCTCAQLIIEFLYPWLLPKSISLRNLLIESLAKKIGIDVRKKT